METKKEAEKLSKEVLSKLDENWTCHIWKNMGWHVCWVNGAINLHYNEYRNTFWCMVGEPNKGWGHLDFSRGDTKHFDEPVAAVHDICNHAQKIFKTEWQPIIDSVNDIEKKISENRYGV